MAYERDYTKDLTDCEWPKPKLPSDLCCDGCKTHCKFSIGLDVRNGDFIPEGGRQKFWVEPVVYADNVKVQNRIFTANMSVGMPSREVPIEIWNADWLYQAALAWCRATCKHSKMR